MIRRARFEFGASAFEASIASPPWTPGDDTLGGVRVAASGLPASYIVRRDALLDVMLRFRESEWPAVLSLVTYGQTGQVITFFPDAEELTTFDVYLQTPAAGERWAPSREATYPRVLTLALTLRGAASVPWSEYFTDA